MQLQAAFFESMVRKLKKSVEPILNDVGWRGLSKKIKKVERWISILYYFNLSYKIKCQK